MIWLLHTSTSARSLLPWFYTLLLFLIHEMSDPCIRVHLICIQWREELLCFIQYFCVCAFFFFSWDGSSMLMKSAMLLDLEFQHGIPFMSSYFPIPLPLFFMIHLPFPLSSKIQLCWTACNSPKFISLCFCLCSYLFVVIVKDHICLYLPGKTLSSEVGLDGFAGLPLSSGSAID